MITLFEDYWNTVPEYQLHLPALRKLAEVVGEGHVSLQLDGRVKITHYVGFFQFGNSRIQILPKVFAKNSIDLSSKSEIDMSLRFVYRMLYWSDYFPIKELKPQLHNTSRGDLMEIFIGIFIREFTSLFRQKVYRNYIQQEENQSFIKGKILVSETIRKNPVLKHLHYTRYDEFSLNNPLNQIFKALIWGLLKKTRDLNNKKQLVVGLTFLQDVDLAPLSHRLLQQVKFNRLNTEFEPLFNFARLFFHNQQPGLEGGEEKSFSFLVRMNILFEKFIARALAELSNDRLQFQYHKHKLYLDKAKSAFRLEPDFTVYIGEECHYILDAKYKYPLSESGAVNISTGDLYQLSTYALRYDCKKLVLIYPKFEGARVKEIVLSIFSLTSGIGPIELKILQVDIMATELSKVVEELRIGILPA